MAGYLSSRKLTNVKGRLKYISDKDRQENIIDYHNTTDDEFWKLLAKESQLRHKEVNARGKCCEARELIIGLLHELDVKAKQLCDIFKSKYDVECSCAIHQNCYCQYKNVQFGQNIFEQNCTFLFCPIYIIIYFLRCHIYQVFCSI